jgi:alpha-tubulin suppressor-like RCC1 family protein
MSFNSTLGNLKDIFVTEEELIERFTGKQLWAWGSGLYGRLGNNATTNQSSPVQTISGGTNWRSLSTIGNHTAAIKTNGELWSWGSSDSGQMGDNTTINRSSPVQTISGGTSWRTASAGCRHTAATKTDGTLWLWGRGYGGILGTNTSFGRSSPVQTVSGGDNWRTVSAGFCHTAAIKTDGTLWAWGYGSYGRIGNNATTNRSSPVQTISGGTNWQSVSAGASHTAAIKTNGELWMWGYGTIGQLGDNATINRSSPVQTISGGTNWRSVSVGVRLTAATKTDGTLWLWGFGRCGVFGNNAISNQSSPVQTISGGTNWRTVSAGYTTAAIKTDGTLWVWGDGICGRLGNNATTNQSSPVQTISGGTSWRSVGSSGIFFGHTAATRLEEF